MDVPKLPPRDVEAHKGTFGRALIVGGSRGMTGAPALSAMAAARSGAGLVTAAVPNTCLETVATYDPCYMTVGLADDGQGRLTTAAAGQMNDLVSSASSVGIGPGLSQSDAIDEVVVGTYARYPGPMVVDADGLNALASSRDSIRSALGPRILTPHIGEFRRLLGQDLAADMCRNQVSRFAADHRVIVVLKGNRSLVTDGETTFENDTGNPGMATGGSGDVLTGVITGLLGQGLSPFDAAVLGVHVHGLAGDLACDEVGEVSLIATDILEYLPEAFRELS